LPMVSVDRSLASLVMPPSLLLVSAWRSMTHRHALAERRHPHRPLGGCEQARKDLVQLPRPDLPGRGIQAMQAQAVVAGAHGEGESTESNALRLCGSGGGEWETAVGG
jgi:hypothetical protein